jgi:Uma2 family endonuclease
VGVKEDVRAEWVDGEVIVMSPSNLDHSELFGFLHFVLRGLAESRRLGKVLGPELFVRFATQKRRRLPDILYVSHDRESTFRRAHVEGAPDMIMEIVSPDSVERDWHDKFVDYQAAGVREYWIIDPMAQRAEVYVLSATQKYERIVEAEGWLASAVVPGWRLKTSWLSPATRPLAIEALAELNAMQ